MNSFPYSAGIVTRSFIPSNLSGKLVSKHCGHKLFLIPQHCKNKKYAKNQWIPELIQGKSARIPWISTEIHPVVPKTDTLKNMALDSRRYPGDFI